MKMIFQKIFIFVSLGIDTILVGAQTNLLRGKAAMQSSYYDGWTADKALDGDYSEPCSSTHFFYPGTVVRDLDPWWEVDIGSETPMNTIKLFNQGDNEEFSGVKVRLLDGDLKVLHLLETVSAKFLGAVIVFNFEPFSPQYIQVYGVAPILTLCEVEAYFLIEPTTKPSTSPSAKTSLAPSSLFASPSAKTSLAPSSLFAGQNFVIGKPQSRFNNDLGDFSVSLNYTKVGRSVDFLNVTLREAGCDKPVTDAVIMMNTNVFLKADFATPSVKIDTTKFSASKLVNKSQGESIGVLKFCVRAEGYDGDLKGDTVSVSFRQDDISVGYNLTSNNFKVQDNKIIANKILLSENNVTASYSVDAFRCSTNYEADSSSEVLKQNDIMYVCIKPANTSVYISDFNMAFWQDGAKKYTAVSVGVIVNPLSQLSTGGNDDKTKRVASRVISKFFEDDATPFVVKGNAFLSFSSTDSRRLRSVQDSSQVEEGYFEMEVGLEKGISSTTTTGSSMTNGAAVLCVIGGILVLSFSMVVFKKMRV